MRGRAFPLAGRTHMSDAPERSAPAAGSTDLVNGPIGRTLVAFSLPTLASSALQSASTSLNAVWVGRFLGEDALAATANGNILTFLMLAFVFGFGMAATILIGQTFGRGDPAVARRVAASALSAFVPAAVVLSALGWLLAPQLLAALGTPEGAEALALSYLRVIFLALPLMLTFTLATMALRGAGDARTPLWFMALSVALDSGLNPLLIAGLGPFPELGIAGAALATLIANAVALPAMVLYLYRRGSPLALPRAEIAALVPRWAILREVIVKGVPIGLQMIVISSAALTMLRLVNAEGIDTTAAYSVVQQLWTYVQMPAMAVGGAVSAMAAQNIGAGRWDRVGTIARDGVILSVGLTALTATALMLLDVPVLQLFLGPGSPALPEAVRILWLATWGFLAFAAALVLFGTVRANGAVVAPLVILAVAMYPVRLGFALALRPLLGADALWWSFPVGMLAVLAMAAAYYARGSWRGTAGVPPDLHECECRARATREAGGTMVPA